MAARGVGVGEIGVVTDASAELVIYGLGSCVGVAVLDPEAGVGGLLHALLPDASFDPGRADAEPAVFVDTGIDALLEAVVRAGAAAQRLHVVAAGGARTPGFAHFEVGQRNVAALRTSLAGRDLGLEASDLGGAGARTMRVNVGGGTVTVLRGGDARLLLGSPGRTP